MTQSQKLLSFALPRRLQPCLAIPCKTDHALTLFAPALLVSSLICLPQDGHEIHHTIPVIFKAAELGIEIVSYPPHSTDALQGLDKVVFGPLKRAWTDTLHQHIRQSYTVQKKEFARLYEQARAKAMATANVKKAFESTGVHPINRNVVPPGHIHRRRGQPDPDDDRGRTSKGKVAYQRMLTCPMSPETAHCFDVLNEENEELAAEVRLLRRERSTCVPREPSPDDADDLPSSSVCILSGPRLWMATSSQEQMLRNEEQHLAEERAKEERQRLGEAKKQAAKAKKTQTAANKVAEGVEWARKQAEKEQAKKSRKTASQHVSPPPMLGSGGRGALRLPFSIVQAHASPSPPPPLLPPPSSLFDESGGGTGSLFTCATPHRSSNPFPSWYPF